MNKNLLAELKRNLPRFEEEYKNGETLIAMKFIRQDEHGGYLQFYTCTERDVPRDNACDRYESLSRLIADIKEAS
jgi:hypothetical protein